MYVGSRHIIFIYMGDGYNQWTVLNSSGIFLSTGIVVYSHYIAIISIMCTKYIHECVFYYIF